MTAVYKIEPTKSVRVKWGKRWIYFTTPAQAANRMAWWMIFEKHPHGQQYKSDFSDVLRPYVEDVPANKRLIENCDCLEESWGCKIHDPHSGYLKRLHTRLARLIRRSLAEIADGAR